MPWIRNDNQRYTWTCLPGKPDPSTSIKEMNRSNRVSYHSQHQPLVKALGKRKKNESVVSEFRVPPRSSEADPLAYTKSHLQLQGSDDDKILMASMAEIDPTQEANSVSVLTKLMMNWQPCQISIPSYTRTEGTKIGRLAPTWGLVTLSLSNRCSIQCLKKIRSSRKETSKVTHVLRTHRPTQGSKESSKLAENANTKAKQQHPHQVNKQDQY